MTFGCLTTLVGLERGHKSPVFVLCFILGGIILHDSIRLRGSMDKGGRASLLVAQQLEGDGGAQWLARLRPFLGDRRHRPLHVLLGLMLGSLSALLWHPALG
jgi:acid phosphatase family membrane protein YuiD